MKKIIKNTIINILLISPLFILMYIQRNHPFMGFVYTVLVISGGGLLVIWGLTRIVMSSIELYKTLSHIYDTWKQSHRIVKQDDRLEICSKCNGKGYTFWINNINGKPS
jgi:hypothetical protein